MSNQEEHSSSDMKSESHSLAGGYAPRDGHIRYADTYIGLKCRYGCKRRPPAVWTLPKGWLVGSCEKSESPRYPFGTVDYPFKLNDVEMEVFEVDLLYEGIISL